MNGYPPRGWEGRRGGGHYRLRLFLNEPSEPCKAVGIKIQLRNLPVFLEEAQKHLFHGGQTVIFQKFGCRLDIGRARLDQSQAIHEILFSLGGAPAQGKHVDFKGQEVIGMKESKSFDRARLLPQDVNGDAESGIVGKVDVNLDFLFDGLVFFETLVFA